MSIKRKVLTGAATLTMVGAVTTVGTVFASAATPECGDVCISVFSKVLGAPAHPSFVEAVLGGVATVGQPLILKQASGSDTDPSEDIIPYGGSVSAFYAAGMVSAEVNSHYGSLTAVQQEYAPLGVPSGLCVGLASVAYQDEPLTLQPCSVPATTVWILNPALSQAPGTSPSSTHRLRSSATRSRWTCGRTQSRAITRGWKSMPAACSSSPTRTCCRTASCGALIAAN
ncbi:hypothetical protein [Kribbella sp. VKM Ac-2568]|uniref:hypothetical protein n=1 Tax=Kribbella sp. VKM Ac-2568 TaxID=2512219 RepID=UPI001053BCFB|nr:hypothetical protein [Kribbella sp. VKM Ac-2568]TCM46924.1 hypothetical protein EV648_105402 [Kribbella sp. VKM Ac-2568]